MHGWFSLSVFEGRELGSFVVYFDGIGYDVGGRCIRLLVGGIMTASEKNALKMKESSSLSYKSEM